MTNNIPKADDTDAAISGRIAQYGSIPDARYGIAHGGEGELAVFLYSRNITQMILSLNFEYRAWTISDF